MSEASEQPRDGSMIRFIRSAISKETQQSSDAELLEKFVSQHDNAAFELLVDHHSAAILRACRSVLKDHHAAED
ncbi:hypothetical protein ABTE55_19425, partial [Acinetobacter baumannii]